MSPEQVKAIEDILRLAHIALGRREVELLHEHFREIINVANRALKPPAR